MRARQDGAETKRRNCKFKACKHSVLVARKWRQTHTNNRSVQACTPSRGHSLSTRIRISAPRHPPAERKIDSRQIVRLIGTPHVRLRAVSKSETAADATVINEAVMVLEAAEAPVLALHAPACLSALSRSWALHLARRSGAEAKAGFFVVFLRAHGQTAQISVAVLDSVSWALCQSHAPRHHWHRFAPVRMIGGLGPQVHLPPAQHPSAAIQTAWAWNHAKLCTCQSPRGDDCRLPRRRGGDPRQSSR